MLAWRHRSAPGVGRGRCEGLGRLRSGRLPRCGGTLVLLWRHQCPPGVERSGRVGGAGWPCSSGTAGTWPCGRWSGAGGGPSSPSPESATARWRLLGVVVESYSWQERFCHIAGVSLLSDRSLRQDEENPPARREISPRPDESPRRRRHRSFQPRPRAGLLRSSDKSPRRRRHRSFQPRPRAGLRRCRGNPPPRR